MKVAELFEAQEGRGPRKMSRYGEWLFNVRGFEPFKVDTAKPFALNLYYPDRKSTGYSSEREALENAPTDHESHWQIIDTSTEDILHEPEWWYQFHWLKQRQGHQK